MVPANLRLLAESTRELAAPWVSEVVLQTSRFDEMHDWYAAVIGLPWYFENTPLQAAVPPPPGDKQVRAADVRCCFMRLAPDFPHGATLALFELPWVSRVPSSDPGLNHMQLKNKDLDTLVRRLELLRAAGIVPHRSANHGPTLSFYFRDPDQNIVEFCINNFDSLQQTQAFVRSDAFRANPSGLELELGDFLARYRAGTPKDVLLSF